MLSVREIQKIKESLGQIKEERIRAEERLKQELEALKKLGFNTIEDAEEELESLQIRIDKLGSRLQEEYKEFMDEYGEIVQ
jgi:chromosome segregation ATPase